MSLRGKHRHITLRHERHLLNNTSPALAPGEAKFLSYSLPSLQAGPYEISIQQKVTAPGYPDPVKTDPLKQNLEVIAPEWALTSSPTTSAPSEGDDESAVVLSVFPAPGETAPSFRTLPHIVLRDAQLPWARSVSEKVPDAHANEIPWFALLVFTAEELALSEQHRDAYFKPANGTINETLGWDITVGNLKNIRDARLANFIPGPSQTDVDVETKTSLIAVPAELFTKLFTNSESTDRFDVSPYRFMSHVRTVGTAGTMSATMANDTDSPDPAKMGTATFSMVISSRLGPTNTNVPTPVLAHLVSLQGIDTRLSKDIGSLEHVLMTSLYSWTYTALPPGAPDVASMLRYLGDKNRGLSVLRTDLMKDVPQIPPVVDEDKIGEKVTKRQMDGYTLVRHRAVTGEQTASMLRGPFTPTVVPHPLHKDVSFQSNFGTDLQILDPVLGMMDISYATAWQLGKTLALADPAFTAALSRLRTTIHNDAIEAARKDAAEKIRTGPKILSSKSRLSVLSDVSSRSSYFPRSEIKTDIADIVGALNSINADVHTTGTSFSTNRWNRKHRIVDNNSDIFSLKSEHIFYQMSASSRSSSRIHAEATGGGPYHYHTVPNNTDYAIIQEWILDKLHLSSVPAHNLLPDPSYVPPETLRFFYVDSNWTDAMIDGALSLANHLTDEPAKDYTRSALKEVLNRHFSTPTVGDYLQQMPAYGFILRSQLLVQFPDLAISAEFENGPQAEENDPEFKVKAPILVQRRLASDMMLVLFDRTPEHLASVTFTLPAHQQTFVAAFAFSDTTDEVEVHYKRVYATGADNPLPVSDQKERREQLPVPDFKFDRSRIFDWETRTLKIFDYADLVHQNLVVYMPEGQYNTKKPTAAVFALQLNEPVYTLVVTSKLPKREIPTKSSIKAHHQRGKESLTRWDMLEPPPSFRFFPPKFPIENHKPKTALPVPINTPTFKPTRLPTIQKKKPSKQNTWVVVAPKRHEDIPPSIPAPHPVYGPTITFGVFPIGFPNGSVPTNNPVPLDLIFSVIADSNIKAWDFRVTHFDLAIPYGSYTDDCKRPTVELPDDAFRALLRSDAPEGPALTMLSNSRFNVLRKRWDDEGKLLHISIVPRSSWGVRMQGFHEASYLMPLTHVYPWKVPKGKKYRFKVFISAYMKEKGWAAGKEETRFDYECVGFMESP